MAVPEVGSQFAGYRIESLVGRGGMGVVYRATQLDLGRTVALKLIAPEALEDEAARSRFVSEVHHAAAIEHPNVVPIYAAGEQDGTAYFVMRFVEGDDLRTRVRRDGPLAPVAAAAILQSTGSALDAIHRAGLVHRDVKPANILLADGDHVYLTDFGLARVALARESSTGSGRWAGSLNYAAPEQIRGGRVDARADVYALGGVLVFMLTGKVPYDRDSDEATLWAHVADPPPRPSDLRRGLPRALDAVVEKAMAKAPEDRYASAGDLGRAAVAAAEGRRAPRRRGPVAQGAASPTGAIALPGLSDETPTLTAAAALHGAPPQRRRLLVGGLAAAAVLALAAGVLIAREGGSGDDHKALTARTPAATAGAAAAATPTATAAATRTPGPHVARIFRSVSHRPNALVRVGSELWVTSVHRPLVRLDALTGRPRSRDATLGPGTSSIARSGNAVWVANPTRREVVAVAAAPPHRLLFRLPQGEIPVDVEADPGGGAWVAVDVNGNGPGAILRYDANGRQVWRKDVAAGVRAIAVSERMVWAAEYTAPKVMRIDRRTMQELRGADLTDIANELAYGGGCAWAAIPEQDAVARMCGLNAPSYAHAGRFPEQLTYTRGRLYVASRFDQTLVVIDPRTMGPARKPLRMPINPFAVTSDRRHVWVTSLGADTVTRVDLD